VVELSRLFLIDGVLLDCFPEKLRAASRVLHLNQRRYMLPLTYPEYIIPYLLYRRLKGARVLKKFLSWSIIKRVATHTTTNSLPRQPKGRDWYPEGYKEMIRSSPVYTPGRCCAS